MKAASCRLVAIVGFLAAVRPGDAGAPDEEYQTWASKVYQADDKEGVKRGEAIACAFCQIGANAVQKQFELNKQKPREERYTEEQTEEVLLDICESTAPKIAKQMQGYKKDALMLCRRVVKENLSDMLDAAALGEDMNLFCRENKICPFGMDDMMKMMELMNKFQAEKNKEEESDEL
mmetsp:Transcript_134917/g.431131  ORF Transcript_134917/g.431131 Transcript_134917/m.431131 type:complete len:177 (-) Transcript_134917:29-559(-)|eukprot:CAMPEP_0203872088 /NCGR_PEP_ID=MMETSP0359-20131031/19070_1 /ASSEMBLY_ACC=CAM_ASM_000338 /TAXON_ID=268821 /ORGANISM="Scrippsiella Hangoei, Strain SHTV-5" /LENGTH=176 /DNA_ID=CAMNT_0050790773 /DNA_START=65 /DNA_END=595 /DNA_ORIENTATION=-